MVFKIKIYIYYSPLRRVIIQWVSVVLLLLSISDGGFAYSKKEVKSMPEKYGILMAVFSTHNRKKEYSTISRTTGNIKYKISEEPVVITSFKSRKVILTVSTFKEFYNEIQPEIEFFKYLNKLPEKITEYLDKLEVKTLNLDVNLIIIPKSYQVFYESNKRSLKSERLNLTFIVSYKDFATIIENRVASFEIGILNVLPHEVFHLLDLYLSLIKTKATKSLRKETYAVVFGECVSYEIFPKVTVRETKLSFPDYFFYDPSSDLKKVRKKLVKKVRKGELHESKLSNYIARYYFQAVANNHTGKNIKSNTIPKFCHKLFSEHNFKHPIEKKPPPWFKEFLETK